MRVGNCVNGGLFNRAGHKSESSLDSAFCNRKTVRNLNITHLRMSQMKGIILHPTG